MYAGRVECTVRYFVPCFRPRCTAYTLDAHTALFHNSAGTDGDIWVELVAKIFRPDWFPVVELTSVIRAIVAAVAGPNTPVIDLNIQSVIVVVSRVHRANGFTWRVFTVLTEDRNEACFDVRPLPFPVTLYSDPG